MTHLKRFWIRFTTVANLVIYAFAAYGLWQTYVKVEGMGLIAKIKFINNWM